MKLLALTGFLGSGKTTLLLRVARHLCDQGQTVAIIENEVGKIGIDDQFLERNGLNVKTVFGGCVCCTLQGTLHSTLKQIHEQINPDWVIVEPSGVAAPSAIYEAFSHGTPFLNEICMFVLVDPARLRMMKTIMHPFLEASLGAADLVLLNKIDLQTPQELDEIRKQILAIRKDAPLLEVSASLGTNFDRLVEFLGKPHPVHGAVVTSDSTTQYPTSTRVISRQRNLKASVGVTPEKHVDQVSRFLRELSLELEKKGCSMIGHIKAILKTDGEYTLLRLTQFGQIPDREGTISRPFDQVLMDLAVIVCGIEEKALEECVDRAFQNLRLE